MGDAGDIKMPRVGLQTAEHEELLNIIDTLRSQGITRYIDLPQLIVCGDQSSGKSSVLEAISGLRFPTKDNLCTRFATELILRRGPTPTISVSIVPGDDRSEKESDELLQFATPSTSVDNFAEIVHAAESAMGLIGTAKVFAKDILRVELSGPEQPHLTLVDLPGIFHAGDKSQSDDDASIVRSLVESYMNKSRSIILAVVSAKNDLAMQIITKLAREIDPTGNRTLGIITKPDLLHEGSDSESAFIRLAKNENITFKLGWHVLKNRDYDTRNSTVAERDFAEKEFFATRVWSTALPASHLGINSLRPRLSRVLLRQILRELPSLISDVETETSQCHAQLRALGSPRTTSEQQRLYLIQASQKFVTLMTASKDGKYNDSFFGNSESDEGYRKRLRAVVQCTLTSFAEEMHTRGHATEIVDVLPEDPIDPDEPKPVLYDQFLKDVQRRMDRNRGRELPGLFNPDIIEDLFYDQAKPWEGIIYATLDSLVESADVAVRLVLEAAADEATLDGILALLIRPNFEPIKANLFAKAEEVLRPHRERWLLTFNDYFISTLRKKRQEQSTKSVAQALKQFFGTDPEADDESDQIWYGQEVDVASLLEHLTTQSQVDMDVFAAIDATNAMQAYYKTALKSVIDNFGMYAIEACLLVNLTNLFNPEVVFNLDDATISRIAAESEDSVLLRDEFTRKLKVLNSTMKTLQRLRSIRDSGSCSDKSPRWKETSADFKEIHCSRVPCQEEIVPESKNVRPDELINIRLTPTSNIDPSGRPEWGQRWPSHLAKEAKKKLRKERALHFRTTRS